MAVQIDQGPKTPNPEYAPDQNGRLIAEIRQRLNKDEKFKEDLRNFLGMPAEQFQAFPNPSIDIINIVLKKLCEEDGFQSSLKQFLSFCKETEHYTREPVQVTRDHVSRTIDGKKKNLESKDLPLEILKKRTEFADWCIKNGYPLSGSQYFQICSTIREVLTKPKRGILSFFKTSQPVPREIKDIPITPRHVLQHMKRSLPDLKKSPLPFHEVRSKAEKAKITCEPYGFNSEHPLDPLEPVFVLTSDGYCLLLVLDEQPYKMFYDPERL